MSAAADSASSHQETPSSPPDGSKEPAKEEKKPFRPSKKAIVIGVVVLLILLLGGLLYWLHARQFVSTDDAYTTAHVHEISARVAGTVSEVLVDDNQLVPANTVLVRLDPRDYEVALQRAQAGLTQAEAQVGNQEAVIEQARAGVTSAEAQAEQARSQVAQAASQAEKAQQDYDRFAGLYAQDQRAVSKADVDAATATLNSAKSTLEAERAQLTGANAQTVSARANADAAQAQLKVAQANVIAARAGVANAELQLSYCEVRSPVRGKVSKKTVESGLRLAPGQALMAIVPDDVWVLANLKETQLAQVRLGQRVDIGIDALPDRTFYGSVQSIQEGSGATFSLLPPDNATGNFTKIVQRVPVKIVFDEESIRDFHDRILPGLSVEPRIDLRSLQNQRREPARQEKIEKQNRHAEDHE